MRKSAVLYLIIFPVMTALSCCPEKTKDDVTGEMSPESIIPENPDRLTDPKRTMVNLARKSQRRKIKIDMVPTPKGGRKVGPAYTSCLIEFVSKTQKGWNPLVAMNRSESLKRCLKAVGTIKKSSILMFE